MAKQKSKKVIVGVEPKNPEAKKASVDLLQQINPSKPPVLTNPILDKIINHDPILSGRQLGQTDYNKLDPTARAGIASQRAQDDLLIDYDFNYEYVNQAFLEIDNKELQAQKQTTWDKTKRGIGRLLGETVYNVADMGAMLLGGAATVATAGMIDGINESLNGYLTRAKEAIVDDNTQIYSTKEHAKKGAIATILTSDWMASEGASGLAFFLSALVPGLGTAKILKATQLMTKLGKAGKYGNRAAKALDKIAVNSPFTGISKDVLQQGTGVAANELAQLVSATTMNTLYEATVEARGAVDRYEQELFQRLGSGELSQEQYDKLLATSGEQGTKVFLSNVALLMGPNMFLNKSLLGVGSTSKWSPVMKKLGVDEAGHMGLKSSIKKINKNASKLARRWDKTKEIGTKVGKAGYNLGKAYTREGLIEEVGQMTVEDYFTSGYLNEKIYGQREKDLIETYAHVLGSKEGQIAAMFGGILGGGAYGVGALRTNKITNKRAEELAGHMNNGLNYYMAARQDFRKYEFDENGYKSMVLDKDFKPVIDQTKVAAVGEAHAIIEGLTKAAKLLRENGDHTKAEIIEARIQADGFFPFLGKGEEGYAALREALLANPVTEEHVKNYNETQGTSHSKESYVEEQVQKARNLGKNLTSFQTTVQTPLYPKDFADINAVSKKDKAVAEEIKKEFDTVDQGNYVALQAALDYVNDKIFKNNAALYRLGKDIEAAENPSLEKELTRDKDTRKKLLEQVKELVDVDKAKDRFKKYYNNKLNAEKYNSGELTNYLDGLMKDISEVNGIEELTDVINKAKDEGVILSGVKSTKLPQKLIDMFESDNATEMFTALSIFDAHKDDTTNTEYYELASEARRKLDNLLEEYQDALSKIPEYLEKIEKQKEELNEEYFAKINRYNQIMLDLGKIETDITRERKKGVESFKSYRESYLKLVKAKTALIKESNQLDKEINTIDKKLNALFSKRVGAEVMESLMGEDQEGLLFWDSVNYFEKNFNERAAGDLAEYIEDLGEETILKKRVTFLKGLKASLTKVAKEVQKAIDKYKKYKKSPQTSTILIELERQLDTVLETVDEVTEELAEAELKLEKIGELWETGIYKNAATLNDKFNALTDLKNGANVDLSMFEPTTTETKPTPKKPKTPKPVDTDTDTDTKGFKPVVDPTGGKGADRIEGPIDTFAFKTAFAENETIFNKGVDAYTDVNSKTDPAALANGLEIILHYHPDLANDSRVKEFLKARKEKKADRKLAKANAQAAIEKYESDPNDKRSPEEKKAEADLTDKANKFIDKVKKATEAKPEKRDNNLITEAKNVVADINRNIKIYKKSVIEPKLRELKENVESVIRKYTESVKVNKPTDTKTGNPVVDTINTSDGIKKLLNDLVNQKRRDLKEEQLVDLANQLVDENARWDTALGASDVFSRGNKVKWQQGPETIEGEIKEIIKAQDSGANALILDSSGKLHLVSTMRIEKEGKPSQELNKDSFQAWKTRMDSETDKTVISNKGDYTAVRLKAREGSKFADYLAETRDKSDDELVLEFAFGKLPKERTEGQIEAEKIFNDLKSGNRISNIGKAIDVLAKHAPIRVRVDKGPGIVNNAVNTPIPDAQSEAFGPMEMALRKRIIGEWIATGAKLQGTKNNLMFGIGANWAAQSPGVLNVKNNTKTKLTDFTYAPTINDMNLLAIRQSNGVYAKAYNRDLENVDELPSSLANKVGQVFMMIKTNRGEDFPLAVQRERLGDYNRGKQLNMAMSILTDLENNTKDKMEELAKIDPEFIALFSDKATPRDVLDTILYQGQDNSQLGVNIFDDTKYLVIGDTNYTFDSIGQYADTIKNILSHKFMRVGFTGKGLKVNNNAYLNYLIDTKAMYTNIPEGQPAFTTVEDGSMRAGLEVYLKPENIKVTNREAFKKKSKVKSTKDVVISPAAKRLAVTSGTFTRKEVRNLSQETVIALNEIAGKSDTLSADNLTKALEDIKKTTQKC